jgi:hypothetical protein
MGGAYNHLLVWTRAAKRVAYACKSGVRNANLKHESLYRVYLDCLEQIELGAHDDQLTVLMTQIDRLNLKEELIYHL